MKVSIITVTYNSAQYLEDCIISVINQTYNNIEYIIIDGKSTDNTVSIIKKHEGKIQKWISETDRGMYDAINKGMSMATGDIIGTLNSDDIFDNNEVLNKIVKVFSENNVDSIYGDLEYVAPDNTNKIFKFGKAKTIKEIYFSRGGCLLIQLSISEENYLKSMEVMKIIFILRPIMS